jgi:hypothetical protein
MQENIDRSIYYRPKFQDPWWRGFNDARNGWKENNIYTTVTARHEYHEGYITGG